MVGGGGGGAILFGAIVLEPIKLKFVVKNIILKRNTFWQSPAISFFVETFLEKYINFTKKH